MKKWAVLIGIFILVHSVRIADSTTIIDIPFTYLEQGEIGIISVSGQNIVRVRAAFLDNQYVFAQNSDGEFIGLIGVPTDAERTFHRLSMLVFYADGSQEYFWHTIQVRRGGFARTTIFLPAHLANLLDEDVFYEEYALLNAQIQNLTDGGNWLETGLVPPFDKTPSDNFGTIRYFNGDNVQRHTGIDYAAPIGTPVLASADGIVVMSQVLPIRGDYILINHGSGLHSGYAHLSERLVEVDDTIKSGDVIGSTGNTGRSTGAHLHWETSLGGVWVNPVRLSALLAN